MDDVKIHEAPILDVPSPATDNKFRREQQAFHRLLPALLQTHRGQYVAVHSEQVVDSGPDNVALAMRAYAKFGYVPIYVDLVAEHPLPPVRIPSPRHARE